MSRGGVCLRTLFNPAHLFKRHARVCVCVCALGACVFECGLGRMSFGVSSPHQQHKGELGLGLGLSGFESWLQLS